MKIALVSHLYPTKAHPYQGKFIQDQFELLSDVPGIEVDLYVPTPYSIPFTKRWEDNHSELANSSENKFRVNYLSFPRKRFPKLIQSSLSEKLHHYLIKKDYDLVHLHWLYPDGMAIPHLNKLGHKTLLTVHGSDWYQNYNRPLLDEIAEDSLKAVNRVLYSGPKLQKDMEDEYPWLSEKSDIIYNLVDTDKYKPADYEKKQQIRSELNWESSKTHVLTVANLREEKGVDLLLDAIETGSFGQLKFHIIGKADGTPYSEKIVSRLKQPLLQNVLFLGALKPEDLIKYYQGADFYVLPSRREGFNVSILEAASCGLPLVCTNVGGNKMVTELGTGIITDSPEELHTSISTMANSFEEYSAENLHFAIESHFGKQAFVEKLISNYEMTLQSLNIGKTDATD